MREKKRTLLALVAGTLMLMFVAAGIGNAALISVTYNPSDVYMSTGGINEIYVNQSNLSLADDGTPFHFNPATQHINSASFLVTLYDNASDGSEKSRVYISSSLIQLGSEFEVDGTSGARATYTFPISTALINQYLADDGATYFDIRCTYGNFYFDKVVLQADVDNNAIPTPEPGTMMLLGSGLVGLAGWGRNRFRK